MKSTNLLQTPLRLSVWITQRNGTPLLILNRETSNIDIIRGVIEAALYNQTIVVLPQFTDRIKSINSMLEKGILYYDNEKDNYAFNF